MKRAIVFLNGNLSNVAQAKKIITKADYIIGVDGGTEYAVKSGFIPHIIIGDFDSLPQPFRKKLSKYSIKKIKYPQKKDKTDFELAVDFALEKKFRHMIIFGLLGNRIDHLLANMFFLKKVFTQNTSLKIEIIEGNHKAFFTDREITIKGSVGDIVSLIPFDDSIRDIKLYGLEYVLDGKLLVHGSTQGISNVMTKKVAKITIKKGVMLVIHQYS
jgi:thiamine pyrophosphokinase